MLGLHEALPRLLFRLGDGPTEPSGIGLVLKGEGGNLVGFGRKLVLPLEELRFELGDCGEVLPFFGIIHGRRGCLWGLKIWNIILWCYGVHSIRMEVVL